jgi:hypothetical protein
MRQGERTFSFYDASGRESVSIYRDLLNRWISHYPDSEQRELVQRLRKGEALQFSRTLAEIIVHEAMRYDFSRIEYHPKLPDTSSRPDFLKFSRDGQKAAYIEVTTCNPAKQDVAAATRFAAIYNAIDGTRIPPGHALGLEIERYGKASPHLGRLKRNIEHWVADAHLTLENGQRSAQMFEAEDWRLELTLLKLSDPSTQLERSIGFHSAGARWIDGSRDIRGALERKTGYYGRLDAPFLIVVADCKGEVGWGESAKTELIEALFGDEAVTVWHDESGRVHSEPGRKPNGLFGGGSQPKNQHVSAVLLIPQPDLWGLRNPMHQPLLVHHPCAQYPLPPDVLPIPSLRLDADNRLSEVHGEPLADLLRLPTDWPPAF